jgi:hypothetical protein
MSAAVLGPKYSYTQLPQIEPTGVVSAESLEIYTQILKISYVKDKSNYILWTIKTNLYQRFGTQLLSKSNTYQCFLNTILVCLEIRKKLSFDIEIIQIVSF